MINGMGMKYMKIDSSLKNPVIYSSVIILVGMLLSIANNKYLYRAPIENDQGVVRVSHHEINKIELNSNRSVINNIPNKISSFDYHIIKISLIHTHFLGTPDHPTIDGGIINSSDGLPVNDRVPDENRTATIINQKITPTLVVKSKNNAFQDNWATQKRIRIFLNEAVAQGKLSYVLNKTNQLKLPASLAVIPMIESNYQTNAISEKGAEGAWQLMPSTAGYYGLKRQDSFQFKASTNAALELLRYLYGRYGNWILAFAAYNAGSKRVDDALQKSPKAKTLNDLDLPYETKVYVKRIMDINDTFMDT